MLQLYVENCFRNDLILNLYALDEKLPLNYEIKGSQHIVGRLSLQQTIALAL